MDKATLNDLGKVIAATATAAILVIGIAMVWQQVIYQNAFQMAKCY